MVSCSFCKSVVSTTDDLISEQYEDDKLKIIDGNNDDNDTSTFFDFKTPNLSVSTSFISKEKVMNHNITSSNNTISYTLNVVYFNHDAHVENYSFTILSDNKIEHTTIK